MSPLWAYYVKVASLHDPTPGALRECIKNQHCWWCDRDGFKSLAGHTSRAHSITADDLRRMAVLFKHIPTCSIELSEEMRSRPQTTDNIPKLLSATKVNKRIMSEAGKASCRERLDKSRSPEQRKKAGQASALKTRKPHPCPACGKILPTSYPITCSPACRKVIRQRAQLLSAGTRGSMVRGRSKK